MAGPARVSRTAFPGSSLPPSMCSARRTHRSIRRYVAFAGSFDPDHEVPRIMAGEQRLACAAFDVNPEDGTLLVLRDLAGAWHSDDSPDHPEAYAGRIDIRPRRHVRTWGGLTPAETAALI